MASNMMPSGNAKKFSVDFRRRRPLIVESTDTDSDDVGSAGGVSLQERLELESKGFCAFAPSNLQQSSKAQRSSVMNGTQGLSAMNGIQGTLSMNGTHQEKNIWRSGKVIDAKVSQLPKQLKHCCSRKHIG